MSGSTSRIWSTSSARMSARQYTRKRSTGGGHNRLPVRVHLTVIYRIVLVFAAFVASDVAGAAEAADPTLDKDLFENGSRHLPRYENVTALMGHTTSNRSSNDDSRVDGNNGNGRREMSSGGNWAENCYRNPLRNRRVDVTNYEYGCKEIKQMLAGDKELVGNGMVRDVYLVEYIGRKAVVKTLRRANDRKGQKKQLGMHRLEVLTLDALNGHPNIVNMLGVCGTTLVTEYFHDNFKNVIRRKGKSISIRRVVSLALDVARGMQALHETVGGVHMDMKPQQLLVDDNGRGKVNDFNSVHLMGSSPDVQGEFCPTHAGKPTRMVPWRSPENVAGEPISEKADIYSLGMIFYSLINGAMPYPTEESFQLALIHNTRPVIDPSWHKGFVKIVEAMWREDPGDRPSARKVVAKLEDIFRKLS